MAPAGLGEPLEQHVAFGVQEDHLDLGAHLTELAHQRVDLRPAAQRAAHIQHGGRPIDGAVGVALELLDQGGQEPRGQVVHGVVTEIFQRPQRDALARS